MTSRAKSVPCAPVPKLKNASGGTPSAAASASGSMPFITRESPVKTMSGGRS